MAPPPSHSQAALPGRNSLVLDSISEEQSRFVLNVRSEQAPQCPDCRRSSSSYHSRYIRTVHDLPWQDRVVQLRSSCVGSGAAMFVVSGRCSPSGFLMWSGAMRDVRIGCTRSSGQSALLREGCLVVVSCIASLFPLVTTAFCEREPSVHSNSSEPVRHLGVDDWAWKKGQDYGTILVDLDRPRVIDLLPGRSAGELSCWLQQQPGIEVIARVRCGIYAEGANIGAPDAIQVSDRFHLVVNLC